MNLIAAFIAAAPLAGAPMQHEAGERARAGANELLRALCPQQCSGLSLAARVEEEDAGGERTPGFETPGAKTVPVLRSVSANVLVDQRLPAAFRSRVRALIVQKLSGAGVPATVQVSQVAFPPRNPPPYVDPQPPKPPEKPAEPEKSPITPPEPASARIADKLIEAAPLLAVALLVGLVLLVLGGLFYFAARRSQEAAWYGDLPPEGAAAAGNEAPREAFPNQRARKLEKQLADDRVLRNQVVREALGKGEHALVARWVRERGEFLLEDLRGDSALAPALKGVAAEIAKPMDAAARIAGLQELEGRTLAARLSRAGEA